MIYNALITALESKRSTETTLKFETGKPSPFRYASTSRMRQRTLRTNLF